VTPPRPLLDALRSACDLGFLGPGPIELHLAHASAMARCVGGPPARWVDLGSGGGVPGLILAAEWPGSSGLLVEVMGRRARFLRKVVRDCGWASRITVAEGRAEAVAREADVRGNFDLATARSFGPPAVTAECATGFLRVGGYLLVSEPPSGSSGRWSDEGLRRLGFGPAEACETANLHFVRMRRDTALDDQWPRRTGLPEKRPLWR
jgi:16S rRNA (guanine527-N7)-methyltransferase